jgi:hypothetical protein
MLPHFTSRWTILRAMGFIECCRGGNRAVSNVVRSIRAANGNLLPILLLAIGLGLTQLGSTFPCLWLFHLIDSVTIGLTAGFLVQAFGIGVENPGSARLLQQMAADRLEMYRSSWLGSSPTRESISSDRLDSYLQKRSPFRSETQCSF